jgi:hypothetical protein
MRIGSDYGGYLNLYDEYNNIIETLSYDTSKHDPLTSNTYSWEHILNGTSEREAIKKMHDAETNSLQSRIQYLECQLNEVKDFMEYSKTKKGRVEMIQLMNEYDNKNI